MSTDPSSLTSLADGHDRLTGAISGHRGFRWRDRTARHRHVCTSISPVATDLHATATQVQLKRKNWRHIRTAIEVPEMSVEVIDDYGRHAERLAELWSRVASRHGEYEHERLTPAYFTTLARYLPGRSHIVALKLDREIVAFGRQATAMTCSNRLGDRAYLS